MKTKKSQNPGGQNSELTAAERAELIRQRAYEIWETRGCPHGCDEEHWLQAEQEIRKLCG